LGAAVRFVGVEVGDRGAAVRVVGAEAGDFGVGVSDQSLCTRHQCIAVGGVELEARDVGVEVRRA
jgi:hypothetical protein